MLREWTPLKQILTVFIVSTLTGLLFVDFYLHRALENSALERWRIDQRALTDSISELVEFELNEALHDLALVSAMPAFSSLPYVDQIDRTLNGIPQHLDHQKREMLEVLRKHFSVLFVLRPNGDHYISHPFSVQRKLRKYNLADRPYFQEAVRTGQAVVSDSFYGADGVLAVALDVPIHDDMGKIVMHLGGVFHLDRLSQVVNKERIGRFDAAFIVDRKGLLIAHTDDKLLAAEYRERFVEHPLVKAFLNSRQESFSRDRELVEFTGLDGEGETLGTYVPMESGWGLVLLRDKTSLNSEIKPQQRETTFLVALILIAIGSVGAPFVRYIGRRWEFAELEVQQARDELEARVAERTAQLRQSEEQIHAIIDNTTSVIYLKNLRGSYLLVNRRFEELFGVGKGEIVGKNDYDLFSDDVAQQLQKNDLKALTRGEPVEFEEHFMHKGVRKHYLSVKFPLADSSGQVYGICGVSTDITERKNAEDELRQLDKMKSEFMATAAHELRTPLTAVLGYSELLMNEELEPELVRECLGTICQKSQALQKLIDQLLDLSKVESGRALTLELEEFDCADHIKQLVKEFRWAFNLHRFVVEGLDEPLLLTADRDRFRQVMENLLGNAVKFSADGSQVTIAGSVEAGMLRISVRDEGIGMAPKQIEKVFEKFYRVDASSTAKQGLGLGLALTRNIVEAHGGKIWLESRQGEGTTVFFELPLKR